MTIPTWLERCETHPAHNGQITEMLVQARMQEEIDELRAEIERLRAALAHYATDTNPDGWVAIDALSGKGEK
jgi:hypothetical protein